MLAQERASRILGAWVSGSTERLKIELEEVLSTARMSTTISTLENEQQQLLESIASDLWALFARAHAATNDRLQSNFALLRHLSEHSQGNYLSDSRAACL